MDRDNCPPETILSQSILKNGSTPIRYNGLANHFQRITYQELDASVAQNQKLTLSDDWLDL